MRTRQKLLGEMEVGRERGRKHERNCAKKCEKLGLDCQRKQGQSEKEKV
jgi:hypothetical protein